MTSTANLPHLSPEHASFFRTGDSGRHTARACASGAKRRRNFKGQDPGYTASGGKESGNSDIATRDTRHESRRAEHTMLHSSCVQQSSRRATFVQCSTKWRDIASSTPEEEVEWVTTEVEGVNITNVYKPPGTRLCLDSLPRFQQPCIYAGDFNCHSTTWGYSSTTTDGTTLEHWGSNTDVTLLYDP